jgi:hypothetical protein
VGEQKKKRRRKKLPLVTLGYMLARKNCILPWSNTNKINRKKLKK